MKSIFNAFYLSLFIRFLRTLAIRFANNRIFKVIVPMGDDGYIVMGKTSTLGDAMRMMETICRHRWSVMSVDEETDRVVATKDTGNSFYRKWVTRYGTLPEYSVFDDIKTLLDLCAENDEELKHIARILCQTPASTSPKKFR